MEMGGIPIPTDTPTTGGKNLKMFDIRVRRDPDTF